MRVKLQQLMDAEHKMSRSAFAEKLEIQPATISHILSGRNKPSYELLKKILHTFPNVRPGWLLLDEEEMLRDAARTPSGKPLTAEPNADTAAESEQPARSAAANSVQGDFFAPPAFPTGRPAEPSKTETPTDVPPLGIEIPTRSATGAAVERIVVFYSDKTFDSFTPKR
ncbi:MAG: helix-turn-helix domain-containing protein [Alistipes sp.]|nr:helix-turn-helix domain-containing protein [Alistipes sp.]